MPLILRSVKGSKLSILEMDGNLTYLASTLSGSVIQVTGSSMSAPNTSITASFFVGNGSQLTSVTASFVTASNVFGPYGANSVLSSSHAVSSSYSLTASFAENVSNPVDTGSLLVTASVSLNTITFTKGNGSTFPITVNTGSGGGGGSGTPGGSDTQIQFNSGSTFSGSANFTFNYPNQSLQQGTLTTASGLYSHAEGNQTQAIGGYSHAEGILTVALVDGSHAEGIGTRASGAYSHAEGHYTTSSGAYSHAEGYNNESLSGYSHVEGRNNVAEGLGSHAEGDNTRAIGNFSHTEGQSNWAGSYQDYTVSGYTNGSPGTFTISGNVTSSFPIGSKYTQGPAFSLFSIISSSFVGGNTVVTASSVSTLSTAYAVNVYKQGEYSHAEGWRNIAAGNYSHAEGVLTVALGGYSHAEGSNTIASGSYSHAEGLGTIASGLYSHAEGQNTIASGIASHAEGYGTIASGSGQLAIGGYNTQNDDKSLFVIGNGTLSNRADGAKFQNFTPSGLTTLGVAGTGSWVLPQVSQSLNFNDDAAAALAGVPLGGLYHTNGTIKIRLT